MVGADDPELLRARYRQAVCLGETGEHAQASRLWAGVAEDRARLLGLDHRETLDVRYDQARNLERAGEFVEAARWFGEVAAGREGVISSGA
ncbi:tetratricopeptide repeat protein [Streptomyces sp. NBRC 109706]|uniref:tetratricopeptide repeat protein n=1 Tax=Streptomyces sp. NBRC 109706 TaxID=1550035 RepID=UPI0007856DA0|nr:tetratricopeptide repeat protein [Streptomyces sp. NBRC 109706]